ncbi:class I SAM-dependent methyltransferase [Pleurocapsa sp. CCALA 161]|uniref:class I SAM-dependent DNA methyltransferase n=1 Tax=Pleurocapsa sp. CCALA 161 TaxID=2107688 RepID=UPI000D076513|nr:class I SAM-dependent methyltransferase [Pleurocapsa sp. CCALA 161]PSB11068.1 class I SAM-dependent methyltransferase [Pleurocapsa sp. CCALA 161]
MSLISRYSQYDSLSPVYHDGKANNEIIIPILDKLLLQYLPKKAQILDLGCGEGSLMKELIGKGYQATGIDGSEGMLLKARENTSDGFYILDDLRSFKLTPTFHAAISISVFLHIMTLEELISVFQNTYNALLENGWFVFELEDEEVYKLDLGKDKVEVNSTNDSAWIMRKNFNVKSKTAQHHHIVFRLIEGEWQRSEVVLSTRAFTKLEVQPALEKIGFTIVNIYDVERDLAINDLNMAGTKVYVCRKL